MFRTFFASTALAGALIASAHAQDTPAPGEEILPAPEGGMEAPAPGLEGDDPFVEEWSAVGIESVTAEELMGAEIRTNMDDERIATVGDVVPAADGVGVEGVVAQFGGFLGFGREQVLIPAEDFEVFRDPDGRTLIRTNLDRTALEAMPEYEG